LTAAPNAFSVLSGAVVENEIKNLLQSSNTRTREPVKKRKSTYDVYEWIVRIESGLFCKYCREFASSNQSNKGAWIVEPFTRVRDLYERATKHNMSQGHKNAAQAYRAHPYTAEAGSVVQQLTVAANNQNVSEKEVMIMVIRAAYFLFKNEVPHTTNWEALLNLLSQTDLSGRIAGFFVGRPRNATYKSTRAIRHFARVISSCPAQCRVIVAVLN
jgi:hypothetical protein